MTEGGDLVLLARGVGGLVVVLVLVAVAARLARRARDRGGTASLRIVERAALSRETYVAVVAAGERSLLLGVTPQAVSILADLDAGTTRVPAAVPSVVPPPASAPVLRRGRHALPVVEPVPAPDVSRGAQPLLMPSEVDVDGHPDLASALRAAGRTTHAGRPAPRRGEVPSPTAADLPRQRRGGQANGSVLSPATWRQAVEALRSRTARRG